MIGRCRHGIRKTSLLSHAISSKMPSLYGAVSWSSSLEIPNRFLIVQLGDPTEVIGSDEAAVMGKQHSAQEPMKRCYCVTTRLNTRQVKNAVAGKRRNQKSHLKASTKNPYNAFSPCEPCLWRNWFRIPCQSEHVVSAVFNERTDGRASGIQGTLDMGNHSRGQGLRGHKCLESNHTV